MSWTVRLATSKTEDQVLGLPEPWKSQLAKKILDLETEPVPHNASRLDRNTYRLRVGPYRLIYRVFADDRLVLIGEVRSRDDKTYRPARIAKLFP